MKIGQKIILFTIILIVMLSSCGPGYKIGDQKTKKIKNIHNSTVIQKSKLNHEIERHRRREQRQINKKHWKKQMKNRYKN